MLTLRELFGAAVTVPGFLFTEQSPKMVPSTYSQVSGEELTACTGWTSGRNASLSPFPAFVTSCRTTGQPRKLFLRPVMDECAHSVMYILQHDIYYLLF